MARVVLAALAATLGVASSQMVNCTSPLPGSIYDYSATLLNGTALNFASLKGQVTIVVNVASFWGETVKNYLGLNVLMQSFGAKGFGVLGFPCAQFYNQEPEDNNEILNALKYVRPGSGYVPSFPLFQLTSVNGLTGVPPIYNYLKNSCPPVTQAVGLVDWLPWRPIMVTDIQWNFEKFLVNKKGVVVSRWDSDVDPSTMASAVQALLNE